MVCRVQTRRINEDARGIACMKAWERTAARQGSCRERARARTVRVASASKSLLSTADCRSRRDWRRTRAAARRRARGGTRGRRGARPRARGLPLGQRAFREDPASMVVTADVGQRQRRSGGSWGSMQAGSTAPRVRARPSLAHAARYRPARALVRDGCADREWCREGTEVVGARRDRNHWSSRSPASPMAAATDMARRRDPEGMRADVASPSRRGRRAGAQPQMELAADDVDDPVGGDHGNRRQMEDALKAARSRSGCPARA